MTENGPDSAAEPAATQTDPTPNFEDIRARYLGGRLTLEQAVDLLEPEWKRSTRVKGRLRVAEIEAQARVTRSRALWQQALRQMKMTAKSLDNRDARIEELGAALRTSKLAEATTEGKLQAATVDLGRADVIFDGLVPVIMVVNQISRAVEQRVTSGEVDQSGTAIDVDLGRLQVNCRIIGRSGPVEEEGTNSIALSVNVSFGDDTVVMRVPRGQALDERQLDALSVLFSKIVLEPQQKTTPRRGKLLLGDVEDQDSVLADRIRQRLVQGPASELIEERLAAGHDVVLMTPAILMLLELLLDLPSDTFASSGGPSDAGDGGQAAPPSD